MPCKWEENPPRFQDTGKSGWQQNPGKLANLYHNKFSKKIGENTLQQIQLCKQTGAEIDCSHFGFHARNAFVAASEVIIAFSWSTGDSPTDGGTKNTWHQAKSAQKIHISL